MIVRIHRGSRNAAQTTVCASDAMLKLHEREIEILTWVARGKTSEEIAKKLPITRRTVDFHVDNAR